LYINQIIMKKTKEKKRYFNCIIFIILNCFFVSHGQNSNINQDNNFDQLLAEKRKINSSITVNNRYKIQLFSGSNESAKKELVQFKKENRNIDATLVFSTPSYKLLAGNYKTRIDAERNLNLLIKKYPNAILIKPNKQN
jgi:hypothetical protein